MCALTRVLSQLRTHTQVRLAVPKSECKAPDIALPKPIFGGNCLQPIGWTAINATTTDGVTFTATPPHISEGWVAYYMELKFAADTIGTDTQYHFTSPAFTWPDTLPFPDCKGAECIGRLL
jgi:hypothetical protein